MKTKIGKLENVKKHGFFRSLEVTVDGEKFYNRIMCGKIPKNIKEQIGKRVMVDYEETTTVFTDWIADRVFFLSFGIPRKYNQILKIEVNEP